MPKNLEAQGDINPQKSSGLKLCGITDIISNSFTLKEKYKNNNKKYYNYGNTIFRGQAWYNENRAA